MSEKEEKKTADISEEDTHKAKEAEPADNKAKKHGVFDEIMDWGESFAFSMLIVVLAFTFVLRIVKVDGPSMNNTLIDGDRVILTHLSYTPKHDDIVVVNNEEKGNTIIKRVIGIEGDDVVIDYNTDTVTVNGVKISNEHNKEPMEETYFFNNDFRIADGVYEYHVPEDHIFVMGDNRNISADSRISGFISEDNIMGKVVFRIYPVKSLGTID